MFLNPWYGSPSGGVALLELHPSSPTLAALDEFQGRLRPGWTIHLLQDGRFFYCSHASQTSSWLPPLENWSPGGSGLPYGWETAVDREGRTYFINHLNKTTSYEDPRKDFQEDPPSPRLVELTRDPDMGFGFVAGSEKPVIVRFVTDGGPSVDKLLPGDQILMINGEDVKKAPRDHVIQLVRSCKENVTLTVCQPPLDNSARKSALLSAAKKQRLKHNPSRVRFAESVDINGAASLSVRRHQPSQISSSESTTPFMPNVLKVFLENGQTKSFKYDTSTTVSDVLESLHQKLGIKCQEHFSLVVEHVKSLRRNKLTLLAPRETLTKIAAQPGAQHLRCLYRITFVPRDAYDMLRKDSVAFEYLFLQCCNDVIQERFSPELKYDVTLRLAALHIHQHALSSSSTNAKISLKTIERECGLDRFVPASLVESMKRKELRKLLSHFLKLHGGLAAPGQKQMTALQAKLHYLKIISELPSYGAKCFSTNEGNLESVMLISPRFGISQISGIRNSMPEPICEIEQITSVAATREDDLSVRIDIALKHPDKENLVVSLDDRDAEELILVLQGYYKLLTEKSLALSYAKEPVHTEQGSTSAPPYHSCHLVQSSPWSYFNANEEDDHKGPKVADFTVGPPYQHLPEGYKIPNGNIPRITDSDMVNSYGTCLRMPLLDSNMNKTVSVYENTGDSPFSQTIFAPCATEAAGPDKPFSESAGDVAIPQTQSPSDFSGRGAEKEATEARNCEVINHVLEMRQMVEDAETYLSDPEGEVTDAESVRSEPYGRLKHSDSLLLLTQGQKLVAKVDVLECEERSESDTDSQSTPQSSPAHKPSGQSSPPLRPSSIVKTSGSSFGLHSPDNLPMNFENPDSNIKALIRQLEDNSGLPYTFAEGTLYLDPDIIDLTMIPPPITPDEEGARMLPSQLSTPPTPFADRESLDQELKALERDVGDLRLLTNTSWVEGATLQSLSESSNAGASDTDDTLSLSSVSTGNDSVRRASSLASLMRRNGSTGGPGFTLAALRQLGINIAEGEDIDSFIANLTIPPPPEGSAAFQNYKDERKMGEYNINDYIIPPPPSNAANDNRSSDIIRRLYEAKEGISRVVGNSETECGEKDNDVDEMRITSEQVPRSPIQAGRVASLQKHFENPFFASSGLRGNENVSSETKHKGMKFNKNKLNLIKELAGHNNFRMNNIKVPREMDVRLAEALAENDKVFRSFNSPIRYIGSTPSGAESFGLPKSPPPVASRVKALGNFSGSLNDSNDVESARQEVSYHHSVHPNHPFLPIFAKKESEEILSAASSGERYHRGVFHRSNTIEGETIPSFNKAKTNMGTLSKSASHGDIAVHGQTTTKLFCSPIKHSKSSVSNEDLCPGNWHHESDGKRSVTSSNDSLTSSSSVATVKSVSVKSLEREDDDPPELPPRSSAKTSLKPPLPRNSSQDNTKGLPVVKGIRTPSPIRKPYRTPSPEVQGDKPPAVPCRTKKISSPTNTHPLPRRSNATLQRNPGSKPVTVKVPEGMGNDFNPAARNSTLPKKFNVSREEEKPSLPSKTLQPQGKKHLSSVSVKPPKPILSPPRQPLVNNGVSLKNSYNQEPPLHTSSPKLPPKIKITNGKSTGNNLNDSLDSGSFDQDSLEETEDVEAMLPASREAYRHTASVVSESLKKLTDMIVICSKYQEEGDNASKDEDQFQRAKDSLTSESRQFVTASKLFVKSATESEEVLLNSLSKCVNILYKMIDLSQLVVKVTSTPSQTQTIVLKVKDVTNAYLSTVRAALSASGRGMDHPSMNTLMGQATSLAGVLTALMRTLKVFTP